MKIIALLFWVLIFIIFYSYLGYGIVLYILVKLKRLFGKKPTNQTLGDDLPEVTLFVTAYNEKDFVKQKVENSFELDYPKDKIKYIWVTDGSTDGTPEMLAKYPEIRVLHEDGRNGKIAAMNRGTKLVETPIIIYSDANTFIGKDSIKEIVRLFQDEKVGCVSGEKRIMKKDKDDAAGAGEGIYWRYESQLKLWDAELNTVVGAAGELFAIRSHLSEEVEKDTLLDDFMISLRLAMRGYTTQYSPNAYAEEDSAADVGEELKRKIRICAGGIQSIMRLLPLLNIFKYGMLSFQYISHRVLRWTLTPLSLLLVLLLNVALYATETGLGLYSLLLVGQIVFYAAAMLGWFLENKSIKVKVLFVPYYFFIMNLSVYLGFFRYIKGNQSVKWDKSKRKGQ